MAVTPPPSPEQQFLDQQNDRVNRSMATAMAGGAATAAPEPGLSPGLRTMFEDTAAKYDVPVNVMMALAERESGYDAYARKPGGGRGIMSLSDDDWRTGQINPYVPAQAIDFAGRKLRSLLDQNPSIPDVVKAFYGGSDPSRWDQTVNDSGADIIARSARIAGALYPVMPAGSGNDGISGPAPKAEDPAPRDFWDHLGNNVSGGWRQTVRSLDKARYALGEWDDNSIDELAQNVLDSHADSMKADANRHPQQRALEKSFERFGATEGTLDTIAGAGDVAWTAFTNPKGVALGVAETLPNMVPSIGGAVGGAVGGAGVGAGVGSVIPGVGTGVGAAAGAVHGSRVGLGLGTAATEYGNELQHAVTDRLSKQGKPVTRENVTALLRDKQFQEEARQQAATKGLTLAAVDAISFGWASKLKPGKAAAVELAGEPVGEAVSQYAARGEIDKGDIAAEAVYGIGSSAATSTAARTVEGASRALRGGSGGVESGTPAAPEQAPTEPLALPAPQVEVNSEGVATTTAQREQERVNAERDHARAVALGLTPDVARAADARAMQVRAQDEPAQIETQTAAQDTIQPGNGEPVTAESRAFQPLQAETAQTENPQRVLVEGDSDTPYGATVLGEDVSGLWLLSDEGRRVVLDREDIASGGVRLTPQMPEQSGGALPSTPEPAQQIMNAPIVAAAPQDGGINPETGEVLSAPATGEIATQAVDAVAQRGRQPGGEAGNSKTYLENLPTEDLQKRVKNITDVARQRGWDARSIAMRKDMLSVLAERRTQGTVPDEATIARPAPDGANNADAATGSGRDLRIRDERETGVGSVVENTAGQPDGRGDNVQDRAPGSGHPAASLLAGGETLPDATLPAQPDDALTGTARERREARRQAKAAAKPPTIAARRAGRIIGGASVGDTFSISKDVGYLSAGQPYRVTAIDRDGTVHVEGAAGAASSLSMGTLVGAKTQGATFTKAESDDVAEPQGGVINRDTPAASVTSGQAEIDNPLLNPVGASPSDLNSARPASTIPPAQKEGTVNDSQRHRPDAGAGAEGSQPGGIQETAGERGAGADAGIADRGDVRDGGGSAKPDHGSVGAAEQPALRARTARSPAENDDAVSGGGQDSDRAGDRDNRRSLKDYRYAPGELKRDRSWKAVAERNVKAVELIKALQAEGKQASPEERAVLARYTGWGASEIVNGVFPDPRSGSFKAGWEALGGRLRDILTPEEYAAARRSTQYAHYTSEAVIRSIYSGLQRMGFAGGRVLEPGMGIGLFKGLMPEAMANNSQYMGVEYDPMTAAIAKQLYPQSSIREGDYSRTDLPRDFFDAAIGNPPFGATRITNDPEYRKQSFMLHDYFFAKTIDRVRPGGLVVFVTSKGTMDKGNSSARRYLAERANLVGAVRLPQTAFKDNAGTEVVTDVLFLQKRGPGIEDNGIGWLGTADVQTPQGGARINEYFAAHPEMVLGEHALTGTMYRKNEYTVTPRKGDIEQHFAEAIANLPVDIYRPERGSAGERAAVIERDFNPRAKKEGSVYLNDGGELYIVDQGSGIPLTERQNSAKKVIPLKPREMRFLSDYSRLRDAIKQSQYDQLNNGDWETSLADLNKAYDAFVSAHGNVLAHSISERENEDGTTAVITRWKNNTLLNLDAENALIRALEDVRPGGTILKGRLLTGRTLNKPVEAKVNSVQDALLVSMNRVGHLDMAEVAKLAGKPEADVISDLGDAIYKDPADGWQTADAYLSGNVVRKLKEARAASRLDPTLKRNVEALKAVQPAPLAPADITVQLGAHWVPATDTAGFAKEALGHDLDITYNPLTKLWAVNGSAVPGSEWGIEKLPAPDLLEAVLNNRSIKITARISDGKGGSVTIADAEMTEAANAIAKKMRDEFRRWVWNDSDRADRLAKHYNEHFNNIVPRSFNGDHLTLPGISSRFDLYSHQKRTIWRGIQDGNLYIAHAVGAGKTYEMIALGMEERRLGLSRKPMFVVPNHMLAQFAREFQELYPTAHVMVADEENFHTGNRRQFLARASLNDPDAIIVTHSAFSRIGMSDTFNDSYVQQQIDAYKEILDEVDTSDRTTVKRIEAVIERLERRLTGNLGTEKKDIVLTFEEMGVDRLFVDEFHEFRKLDFATNRGAIKGIDPSGSQRAMDMHMKVQYLETVNPGRALVAASGTPITNTMGELFTVQRFMQPRQLEEDGLDSFDAWASHFGEVVEALEPTPAGNYEPVSRFANFVNVPDLMRRVRSFMDILTSEKLGDLVQRPAVKGGGRHVTITPVPDGYKDYQKQLDARIKAIRARRGPPKPGDDIILSVISDGRFSAIDMRFVDPSREPDPDSKLNRMISKLAQKYHETADWEYHTGGEKDDLPGASLMAFTDIGLGEQSALSRGFDMKDWISRSLIEQGMKPEHIAFMRDYKQHAKKERLFADMRSGKKRVLIGGKDMETGVNAQKRLAYIGQLDAPWFPASVEQREGRGIRQGNQNGEIEIEAFATKGSYDSTMWGMNARKQRFITQAMQGNDSVRRMEDVSEASSFEMAAALASGDPRYLKLAGLRADVDRLNRLWSAHERNQRDMRSELQQARSDVDYSRRRQGELSEAIGKRKPLPEKFAGEVDGRTIEGRDEFSQALFLSFRDLVDQQHQGAASIGQLGGFSIDFHGEMMRGSRDYFATVEMDLPGDGAPLTAWPIDPDFSVRGIAARAVNQINRLDRDLASYRDREAESAQRAAHLSKRVGAAFPERAELTEKTEELQALEAELATENAAEEQATAEGSAGNVEAADGGKPEFSVSPVQARELTPQEWEHAGAVLRGKPVADVKLGAIQARPGEKASAAAKRWLAENPQDDLARAGLGRVIFDDGGIQKSLTHGFSGPKLSAIIAIPDVVKRGALLDVSRDSADRPMLNHIIAAPITIDGERHILFARLRSEIQQPSRAPRFYIHEIVLEQDVGEGRHLQERPKHSNHSGAREHAATTLEQDIAGNDHRNNLREGTAAADGMNRGEGEGSPFQTEPNSAISYAEGTSEASALSANIGQTGALDKKGGIGAYKALARRALSSAPARQPRTARAALLSGDLSGIVRKLTDSGQLHFENRVPAGAPVGVSAWTDPDGTIHMLDSVPAAEAQAVLLHEAFHMGARVLIGSDAWHRLMDSLRGLYRRAERDEGPMNRFWQAAASRVAAARAQGDGNLTGKGSLNLRLEEFGAYAIEEYERAPGVVKAWVDRLLGVVKAWALRRFKRQIGAVTPAQLRALAVSALRDASEVPASGRAVDGAGPRYSVRMPPVSPQGPSAAAMNSWLSEVGSNSLTRALPTLLKATPLVPLIRELAAHIRGAQDYLKHVMSMDTHRQTWADKAQETVQPWLRFAAKDRQANARLMAFMHETTLAQVDPSKPFQATLTSIDKKILEVGKPGTAAFDAALERKENDDQRREDYARFRQEWDAMQPDAKRIYEDARDKYAAMADERDAILLANARKSMEITLKRAEKEHRDRIEAIDRQGLSGGKRAEAIAEADKKLAEARRTNARNKATRLTRLRTQFETSRLSGPYFRLARWGDYFVHARNAAGETVSFSRHETLTDQKAEMARLNREGFAVVHGVLSDKNAMKQQISPQFVADIEALLGAAGVDATIMDEIWQRYLETFPDMSTRTRQIHRKGTAGYSADAVRAFSDHMFHGAYQNARLKYIVDMNEALTDAREQVERQKDPVRAGRIVNELEARHQFIMNPLNARWAQAVSTAAFFKYLAGTPAHALLNLTQTPVLGIPILAAYQGTVKDGFGTASRELLRASRDFMSTISFDRKKGRWSVSGSPRLTDDERSAMNAAYETPLIDRTQALDLAGVAERGVGSIDRRRVLGVMPMLKPQEVDRIMKFVSWGAHHTERFNREVTYLASYRMARQKGEAHAQAIDTAIDLTYQIHFNYANNARPRMMQNDIGKAALVFRNYSVNMLARAAIDIHQAMNSDSPQARKDAKIRFLGVSAMMASAAGISGTWFIGTALWLAGMVFGGGGEELEDDIKRRLAGLMGETAASVLWRGLPSVALDVDISSRIGMGDLWFRSSDRDLEGADEVLYWLGQLGGAGFSAAVTDPMRALNLARKGHYWRSIETATPKVIGDAMKTLRFGREGALTLKGEPIKESFNLWELSARAAGFQPLDLATRYQQNNALKNRESAIMDQREEAMNRFALTLKGGGNRDDAIKAIAAFNRKYPEVAITPDTVRSSLRARAMNSARTEGGIVLNPRLNHRLRSEAPPRI